MRRLVLRGFAVAFAVGALLVTSGGAASAHPLGNFTVNRYSGIVVAADGVTVEHVLDFAEIPTAQRTPAIDTNHDGRLDPAELAPWAAQQCRSMAPTLRLSVSKERVSLSVTHSAATTAPGQASLPILRLDCMLHAAVSVHGTTTIRYTDTAATSQVGWREVTARGDGVTLVRANVPEQSTSRRLTSYPKDLLTSPLDVRGADLQARPGGARLDRSDVGASTGAATVIGGVTGSFQGLATKYDGSLLVALTALVAAVALGAGHAVAPGHGKTIMAFYLSGRQQGALRAATTVGATVTATHTAGVLALGVLVRAGTAFVPARIYPWLTVLSGALVVTVGLTLLRATRRGHSHGPGGHTHPHDRPGIEVSGGHARSAGVRATAIRAYPDARAPVGTLVAEHEHHDHPHHDHSHHEHAHHDHPHHDHPNEPEPPAPSQRGLVAIGLAGGLLPSPSAVLVFLGALAVGHPWFGVALVIAFGVGMATTLAAVGVLVMRLRERVERRLVSRPGARTAVVLAVLPVLTAVTVTVLGLLLAVKGIHSLGT
jgi:ABC-type nickel/cobalt efflux system permease component RcnA